MDEKAVVWRKEEGVCVITMNTPSSLNAMSKGIVAGLEEAFEDCFDPNIRAVVLTGVGRAFCAGGDLAEAIKDGASNWLLQTPKKLAHGPTQAYASAKALINDSMLQGLEGQMERERYSISACGGSEDFTEGSEALFNKRKPVFKGK